uniref:Uncharacterized protein n=1 Tax=Helicotheca tamesis TaxID=374047 RepID=A0A7S2E1Y1_9STRA
MKVRASSIVTALTVVATTVDSASAFTTSHTTATRVAKKSSFQTKPTLLPASTTQSQLLILDQEKSNLNLLKSTSENIDEEGGGFFNGIQVNIPYALAFAGFLGFATYVTNTLPAENTDVILNAFFADPQHGVSDINAILGFIWNVVGLYSVPLSCLIMPGAKEQKLPATPFLIGSSFGGYGVLGIYASTWKSTSAADEDVEAAMMKKSDLGWFTANVLENKLFNWAMVALLLNIVDTAGLVDAMLTNPGQTVQGYVELFKSSALVSASSVDLTILTTVAASLIPDDLKRRGVTDSGKANLVALSTLLLPVFGLFTYCALRPTMEED